MNKDFFVIKRSGEKEKFSHHKINKVLKWACEGLDVDAQKISEHFQFNYTSDGITTNAINESLVEACLDLITEQTPDYQYVAGRLLNYSLRKSVWGGSNAPRLIDVIKQNIKLGNYDKSILDDYSLRDINKINEFIDHSRDFNFTHAGIKQMMDKYLVQNRKTREIFETPQFAYVLVAMTLFAKEEKNRIQWIKKAYNYYSSWKINLATPVIAGARTPLKSFASCALFAVGDSLDSIGTTDYLLKKASAARYGLGLDISRIRNLGAPIRHGDVLHTGLVPYLKNFESGIKSCHQNGIRGASGTVFINWWHAQVEDVLVLKNNALPDEKAVRFLDYCLIFSDLLIERVKSKGKITLFNPKEVPELVDNFGLPGWDEMYLKRESDASIYKKEISAIDLMTAYAKERLGSGRVYSMHIENCNKYSPFKNRVNQSNLCVTGDQRVVTSYGLLTAKELYEKYEDLTVFNNKNSVKSSAMKLIAKNEDVLTINLENGLSHTVTGYHKILIRTSESGKPVTAEDKEAKNLSIGDFVAIQTNKGLFGELNMEDEAFLLGLYQADGTQHKDCIHICLWENDFDLIPEVEESFKKVYFKYNCDTLINFSKNKDKIPHFPKFRLCDTGPSTVKKVSLGSPALKRALNFEKGYIPSWIWESDERTQWQYIKGLFYADGTVNITNGKGNPLYLSITSITKSFLNELQILLLNLGITSSISQASKAGERLLPDGNGGQKLYNCKSAYRLVCGNKNDAIEFEKNTGFLSRKGQVIEKTFYRDNSKKYSKIKSIEYKGKEDVYCISVYDNDKHFICNGIITHNCVEVLHPTIPPEKWNDENALTGVCILAGVNALYVKDDEFESVCEVTVRMLDNLISYQTYFDKSAENFATKYRSLAIGTLNFAALLAEKQTKYDWVDAPKIAAEFAEKLSYYSIKASISLAKERGNFEYFPKTKWADGELPIDRYCELVDEFIDSPKLDWESLRAELKQFGIRNSTLTSYMPVESSSIISSSTSGLEPIRSYIVSKTSKAGKVTVIAPNIVKNKEYYSLAFDLPIEAMRKIYAAVNKFTCMSISANNYVNVAHYDNKQIPLSVVVKDTLEFFRLGGKTQYYFNTEDDSGESDGGCSSGACSI